MTPSFDHDCAECVFLGQFHTSGALGIYDVYRCPQGGIPTIVARFSDGPEDYISGDPLLLSVGLEQTLIRVSDAA